MKNTFFFLSLISYFILTNSLLGNIDDYINPINEVRKDVVDSALNTLPFRNDVNESMMIESMKTAKDLYSLSDVECAYMVYKWEAQNIEYDCYNKAHDPSEIEETEEGTYNKGKGVHNGISAIFETMVNALGVETRYVLGYSKGPGFVPGIVPSQTNYAWNAIKLSSSYYLVDVTWGSGKCNLDQYEAKFRDDYFCTNPEIFIRTHFPVDEIYQLISPTINLNKFIDMLKLDLEFYENGFKTISPDLRRFYCDGKITIDITYDGYEKKALLTSLYYYKNNSPVEQPNSCWTERQAETAQIICYPKYAGEYSLKIYGGPASLENYPLIVEYEIVSEKDASAEIEYPQPTGLFFNSDMQILYPFYNPLKRGHFINVKFTTTTFDNLYIINNKHYRELDNNGNDEFTGEDVYIFGEEVYLGTLINGEYKNILKYLTIRDSEQSSDASFPQPFLVPKNTLYSPVISNLKVGETYLFKIKCENCKKMAVLEGNNFNYLTKDGSIFSGEVEIKGISKTANIIKVFDTSYITFYRYILDN